MNTETTTLWEANKEWASRPADQRFQTLADLRAAVHSRRLRSRSVDIDLPKIHVELGENNALTINSAIAPSSPSHWSFGQFAGLLRAPANYLRTLPPETLRDCLNHGIKSAPRDAVKFMTVASEDGGLNTLQAVTSPTYGRIWDADCVDAVARLVERTGGKFRNPLAWASGGSTNTLGGATVPSGLYASDRDVFMFMIDGGSQLDAGPRAKLNRGFFVKNSEVGAATFTLTTFLFNTVCGNHIIWGAQDVNTLSIRHTKGGPYRFDSEAAPTLMQYAQSSAVKEETAIHKAMEYRLPKDADELDKLLAPFKFTKSELKSAFDFAKAEEGKCATLWDLVQGFTAYARGFDYLDARVDLEKRAGALLKMVA